MRGTTTFQRLGRAARSPVKSLKRYLKARLVGGILEQLSRELRSELVVIEQLPIQPAFPIDVVYTWVNDADPAFIASLESFLPPEATRNRTTTSSARFRDHDELKYSLRSIHAYAPWVRKIFIVTNGQRPSWASDHPKLQFVDHREILDEQYLPTFNSHVIGSALHKIPGLSEHYIYFNDDVLLLRPLDPNRAFTFSGKSFAYISQNRLSMGEPVPFETATEWAAKNARKLMLMQWGYSFDRRFTHMFHAQLKSVAERCESLFADSYDQMRRNRFRQMNDLLCCSFLHHYVGYVEGETLFRGERGYYVRVRSPEAPAALNAILKTQRNPRGRSVVCLNDYEPPGGGIANYHEVLTNFLEAYFPVPSPYERAPEPPEPQNAAPA